VLHLDVYICFVHQPKRRGAYAFFAVKTRYSGPVSTVSATTSPHPPHITPLRIRYERAPPKLNTSL